MATSGTSYRRDELLEKPRSGFLVGAIGFWWLMTTTGLGQYPVQVARSTGGMVVSASTLASRVGQAVLEEGGNAVDAAVATAFALAVTWPEAGNLGGGGFMLVVPPAQVPVVIDYREAAPLRAGRHMYQPGDSRYSIKAVATPGTVKGLALAHRRYGRLPWRRLVEPAAELARQGFSVDTPLARSLNHVLSDPQVREEPAFAELRRVYGKPDGSPWQEGDRLVLPGLANTLRLLAEEGEAAFYQGPIAQQIVEHMAKQGGLIGYDDLRGYEAITRTPIRIEYRNYTVLAPPPPSSGGICLAMLLGMLEPCQLGKQPRYSPQTLHVMAESMRRAYRERARWLGDPAYWPIPHDLASRSFARRLTESIDPNRATPSEQIAGDILLVDESPETTHFSVVDQDGMAVANTYTLEASYGSRIVVPGAGFLLNNEMGDFNWFAGVTNRNGQIGTPANLIAPGKRMLSSQTPTVVLLDGQPVLLTGSPGGRTIINTVLTILVNALEYQMPLPDAVAHPRMHHQWFPDELVLERAPELISDATLNALREMGHQVRISPVPQGSAHSIWIDPQTRLRVGVADLRRSGFAAGIASEARR
ncbi:MAG: gamma-glutamyltranspeptidase [Pirellulaceae bacterium]|nr:MAG: gamma-glutamyltranspeptidase [Pirellulaceae bacterium]